MTMPPRRVREDDDDGSQAGRGRRVAHGPRPQRRVVDRRGRAFGSTDGSTDWGVILRSNRQAASNAAAVVECGRSRRS